MGSTALNNIDPLCIISKDKLFATALFLPLFFGLLSCRNEKTDRGQADSIVQQIEFYTTGCGGGCVGFSIIIDSNRNAVYKAIGTSDRMGAFQTVVRQTSFDSLLAALKTCHFKNLQNDFPSDKIDPTIGNLIITYNAGLVTMVHDAGMNGSANLAKLYKILSEFRYNQDWKEQGGLKDFDTVTDYTWIDVDSFQSDLNLLGFELENADMSGKINWRSGMIKRGSADYQLLQGCAKIDVPVSFITNQKGLRGFAYVKGAGVRGDTLKVSIGKVKLGARKVILKTDVEGAEAFLIPEKIFSDLKGEQNVSDSTWNRFKVTTSKTNTCAYINGESYVAIFKLGKITTEEVYISRGDLDHPVTVWGFFKKY